MKKKIPTFRKGDRVRLAKRMRKAQQGGPFSGEGTVVGFVPGGRDRKKEHIVVRFPKGGKFGFSPQELEVVAGRPRLA